MVTESNKAHKQKIIDKIGGFLEGAKDGKKVITNDASLGGLAKGKKHTEGGIKGINKSTSQSVEIEAGEPVINERSANMQTAHTFNGQQLTNKEILNHINTAAGGAEIKAAGGEIAKPIVYTGGQVVITAKALHDTSTKEFDGRQMTNQEILSHINEQGGGLSFANGGNMPGTLTCSGKMYNFGGEMQDDYTIAKSCGCRHSKPVADRADFKVYETPKPIVEKLMIPIEKTEAFDELYNLEITPQETPENIATAFDAENSDYFKNQNNILAEEDSFESGGSISFGKNKLKFKAYNVPVTAPSNDTHKKMVLVKDGEIVKIVKFGLRGMQDFTQHNNEERRKNYLTRSAGIVDGKGLPTKDNPLSANYWSRRILWDSGEDIIKTIYVDEMVVLEDGGDLSDDLKNIQKYQPKKYLKYGGNILKKGGKIVKNPLLPILQERMEQLVVLENEYEDIASTIAVKEEKLKTEIDKLQNEENELLYAGLSSNEKIQNLTHCASTMTSDLIHTINRLFPVINKSPYSCSVYSDTKTWNSTVPNSFSVSDHWNFYSQGSYHKLTTTSEREEILKKYPNADEEEKGNFWMKHYWFLAQYVAGEIGFDESKNNSAAEHIGAWVIIDVFRQDFDKSNKIADLKKERTEKQRELYLLTPDSLLSTIDKTKKEIEFYSWLIDNNYNSFEEYEKKAKKALKQKYELVKTSLIQKINQGLITGSVTRKEWGGKPGRFKLISEDTYNGIFVSKTPSTITIKTLDNGYVTGKDYSINIDALTNDERSVFYEYGLSDKTLYDIMGENKYQISIPTKFKL